MASAYEISVDEAALKLGLNPRSVRRLIAKDVLKGRMETTESGRQWFLNAAEVESLVKSYEARREKRERARAALDASKDSPGRPEELPRTTEDDRRLSLLESELVRERELHTHTRRELERERNARLAAETGKALLEGEKLGYERVVESQQKIIALMQQTLLRLQAPVRRANEENANTFNERHFSETEVDATDSGEATGKEPQASDMSEDNRGRAPTESPTTADKSGPSDERSEDSRGDSEPSEGDADETREAA